MKKHSLSFIALTTLLLAFSILLCGCDSLSTMIGNAPPVETRDPAVIESEGANADDVLAELNLLVQDMEKKIDKYYDELYNRSTTLTDGEYNSIEFVNISTPYASIIDSTTGKPANKYAPYFMETFKIYNDNNWMTNIWPGASWLFEEYEENGDVLSNYSAYDAVCFSIHYEASTLIYKLKNTINFYLPYDIASELLTLLGSTSWELASDDIKFERYDLFRQFFGEVYEGMTGFTTHDVDEKFIRSLSAEQIKKLYEFIPTLRYYFFEAEESDFRDTNEKRNNYGYDEQLTSIGS